MNKSIKATLEHSGKDTGLYLSLNIDKGDLPEGSEIVVQVRNKQTGELRPISLGETDAVRAFAQNSRFYGQTMADGHLFNPYIHRRFIAAHFRRLITQYGVIGVEQGVACSYNWDYAIGLIRKEVHRLSNLWRHDREGYNERSRFFTIERVAQVLADYAAVVDRYLSGLVCRDNAREVYVPDYGMLKKQNLRPMQHRFVTFAAHAKACKTYAQLDKLLDEFEWLRLPNHLALPDSFVHPFVQSGAYYTLKHHMMFEGLTMPRKSQAESLAELRGYQWDYLTLYREMM